MLTTTLDSVTNRTKSKKKHKAPPLESGGEPEPGQGMAFGETESARIAAEPIFQAVSFAASEQTDEHP